MQVSRLFLHLDKSIEQAQCRALAGHSRGSLPVQVRRPESSEPCSRRSAAGSIAATWALTGCWPTRTSCSRRSAAGSIAACARPSRPYGRAPDAPADLRRAPLRLEEVTMRVEEVRMFPSVTGGLHCGSTTPRKTMGSSRRRPAGHRRAPKRRHAVAGYLVPPDRAPALQRRAPLREDALQGNGQVGQQVSRPAAASIAAGIACGLSRNKAVPLPPVPRRARLR